mgnify:CR=1 FL=1
MIKQLGLSQNAYEKTKKYTFLKFFLKKENAQRIQKAFSVHKKVSNLK